MNASSEREAAVSALKCPNCQSVNSPDQTVCPFCGTSLTEAASQDTAMATPPQTKKKTEKKKWYIILSVVIGVIMLIINGWRIVLSTLELQALNGGEAQTENLTIITVPESPPDTRPLPALPSEVQYEDFIGELPKDYYFEVYDESGKLMAAEANSVQYMAILPYDGVLTEVVFKGDDVLVRTGQEGAFAAADKAATVKWKEWLDDTNIGWANLKELLLLHTTFDREAFDLLEVEALGYDKVAGRDCIQYKLVEKNLNLTLYAYLDVETKLCLKYAGIEDVIFEVEVFKTDGFSILD